MYSSWFGVISDIYLNTIKKGSSCDTLSLGSRGLDANPHEARKTENIGQGFRGMLRGGLGTLEERAQYASTAAATVGFISKTWEFLSGKVSPAFKYADFLVALDSLVC